MKEEFESVQDELNKVVYRRGYEKIDHGKKQEAIIS